MVSLLLQSSVPACCRRRCRRCRRCLPRRLLQPPLLQHPSEILSLAQAMLSKFICATLAWRSRNLLLSIALCIVSSAGVVAIAALPSPDVCGWPSLREGGRFGPSTVRLAQRLLSSVLSKTIDIDGNFSSDLVADIKEFQEKHGLNTTGVLNSDAWPTLISICSPLAQVARTACPKC